MAITNPAALSLAIPSNKIDQIIGIFPGTLSIPAPTAAQSVVYAEISQPTGFLDTCLTQCVYSIDNGATWNDGDMTIPTISSFNPVFQTVDVTSFSDSNTVGIMAANWYNNIANTGTAWTILYKIYCIAKSNQGFITPVNTTYKLNYTSSSNFLKIDKDNRTSMTLPVGTTTYSVPHTPGYIPNARGYIEYASGRIIPVSPHQYPGTGFGANNNSVTTKVTIDTSNVNYIMANSLASAQAVYLHSRTYLDA